MRYYKSITGTKLHTSEDCPSIQTATTYGIVERETGLLGGLEVCERCSETEVDR